MNGITIDVFYGKIFGLGIVFEWLNQKELIITVPFVCISIVFESRKQSPFFTFRYNQFWHIED